MCIRDRQVEASRYTGVWSDPLSRTLLLRSLMVALAVTVMTVLTAYPVAYFVSFHVSPSKKSLWLFLITIPFWTSYLIRIFLWKVILGFNGVINSAPVSYTHLDVYKRQADEYALFHGRAPNAVRLAGVGNIPRQQYDSGLAELAHLLPHPTSDLAV